MPDRIKINLLPPELKELKKKETQKTWVLRLSVLILVVMVLITSGLLGFVVIQKGRVTQATNQLESTKNNIKKNQESEAIALILRSRIDGVNSLIAKQYPQTEAFHLVKALTPKDIRLLNFSIDRNSKIGISAEADTLSAMDLFFNNLVDPKTNEGKITGVRVETLSRNKDGVVRFDLSLAMAGALSGSGNKPALAPPPPK